MHEPASPIVLEMQLEIPGVEPKRDSYSFQKPVITIGRDETSDVQIPYLRPLEITLYSSMKTASGTWKTSNPPTEQNTTASIWVKEAFAFFAPGDTLKIIHLTLTYAGAPKAELNLGEDENPTEAARNMVGDLMANIGANQDLPYLRVMNGPAEGQKFEIRPDLTEALIGRADVECHFQINDANVSRQHAKILRD